MVATNLPWVIDSRHHRAQARDQEGHPPERPRRALARRPPRSAGQAALSRRRRGHHAKRGANVAVIAAGTGLGEAMLIWDGRGLRSQRHGGRPLRLRGPRRSRGRAPAVPAQPLRPRELRAHPLRQPASATSTTSSARRRAWKTAPQNTEAIAASGGPQRDHLRARAERRRAKRRRARSSSSRRSTAPRPATSPSRRSRSAACTSAATSRRACCPILDGGGFRRAFLEKGRFGALMEKIPVAVVLDSDVGLAGAAAPPWRASRGR